MSRNRLGRGLSSIINPQTARPAPTAGGQASSTGITPPRHAHSDAPPPADTHGARSSATDGLLEIPLDSIRPNRHQPRQRIEQAALEALAASIREAGVVQPVLVRRERDDMYELIAGERRWRAARIAGLTSIPAIVRDSSPATALELALIENLQREDLSALERAAAYQAYLEHFGGTVEELARRLGESRANVANYLRLLGLPKQVQELLATGDLTMGHARALLALDDTQQQVRLATLAVRRRLSVREVEARVKRAGDRTTSPPPAVSSSKRHIDELQRKLSQALGLPVRIQPGRRKNAGRVVIQYNSLEEFDRIAERLTGRSHLE